MKKNIYLGSENGNPITKTVYGKTAKELTRKEFEARDRYKKGLSLSKSRDTFAFWAEQWKSIKYLSIRNGQQKSYNSYLNHLSALNDMRVIDIKPSHLQDIAISLATTPSKRTGKPLSSKTIREVMSTAYQILKLPIKERLIEYNPASDIIIPTSAGDKKEPRRALTNIEQQWIVDTPHAAQRAAMIMMYAGLRRGEVIPLTWSDIDLRQGYIDVNKAVEFVDGQPVVKPEGKTANSLRTIPIPTTLISFLSEEKQKNTNSLLVCPSNGRMITDSGWKSLWESYLTELNLKYGDFRNLPKQPKSKYQPEKIPMRIPRFTAHWLRHTYATMLYLAGIDAVTAKSLLGHADIQTTLNIYTHLDKIYKNKQIKKLDDFLSKANNYVL